MNKLVAFSFALFYCVAAQAPLPKNAQPKAETQPQFFPRPAFLFSRLITAPLVSPGPNVPAPVDPESPSNDREDVTPSTRNVAVQPNTPNRVNPVAFPVAPVNPLAVPVPVGPADPATVVNTPVGAVVPSVVTSRSSQVFAQNFNAPLVAAPATATSSYSSYVSYPYGSYFQAIIY